MKVEIKVPSMGESITEATIGAILKQSGSSVAADDEILELETEKVNQMLYAPQAGVLSLNVSSGDTVKIGQVLGTVDTTGAVQETEAPPKQKAAPASPKGEKKEEKTEEKKEKPEVSEEIPKSKQILEEARLTRDAFLADLKEGEKPEYEPSVILAPPESLSPRPESRKKMSKIRKVIANRLVEAQHTAAMLTTFNEVDMTQVMNLREKYRDSFQKQHNIKLGFMSFFVKACISALQAFPEVNASIDGEDIVYKQYYDIGVAVGTEKGVIVPVVRACDRKTFAEIESDIEKYAVKAREGTLVADDLIGGTFTITNGGIYGSMLSTPILNPPQSAILGMHKITKRPVVIDDKVEIRPMMYLALTYDHRIIDGKGAVSFLVHVKNILEDPARLFLKV